MKKTISYLLSIILISGCLSDLTVDGELSEIESDLTRLIVLNNIPTKEKKKTVDRLKLKLVEITPDSTNQHRYEKIKLRIDSLSNRIQYQLNDLENLEMYLNDEDLTQIEKIGEIIDFLNDNEDCFEFDTIRNDGLRKIKNYQSQLSKISKEWGYERLIDEEIETSRIMDKYESPEEIISIVKKCHKVLEDKVILEVSKQAEDYFTLAENEFKCMSKKAVADYDDSDFIFARGCNLLAIHNLKEGSFNKEYSTNTNSPYAEFHIWQKNEIEFPTTNKIFIIKCSAKLVIEDGYGDELDFRLDYEKPEIIK